jgi:hypothetical protein
VFGVVTVRADALGGKVARPTQLGRWHRCSSGGGVIFLGAWAMVRRLRAAAQRRSSASDGALVTGDVRGELLQLEEGEG